jgi:photosystem II stability/assembly factor-like uncharacterized protein
MSARFYAGTRKGLFRFDRTPDGWRHAGESFLGVSVPMLLPDPRDGPLYAAVEHGHFGIKLHRSSDAGETWEELDAPAYPAKPDGVPDTMCPIRNVPIPWSLEKVWSLEPGGAEQPGVLWCGTLPGGLFRSADRGESWELIRSLWDVPQRSKWAGGGYDFPGIHSICVHPEDPQHLLVAISCGGVWRTRDGGASWEQCAHGMYYDFVPQDQGGADPDGQDPHRMVRCNGAPEQLWVQHHCGIFRSIDDSASWQEISGVAPSAFGFAVAVHPDDPHTAWFVPAKKDEFRYPVDGRFVVNRTRDGGKTFQACSDGLPDTPAYDLVYRHALEVDASGERLAMGSTTGSLWISEDGADHWQTLSRNLPPIYCVRFEGAKA